MMPRASAMYGLLRQVKIKTLLCNHNHNHILTHVYNHNHNHSHSLKEGAKGHYIQWSKNKLPVRASTAW